MTNEILKYARRREEVRTMKIKMTEYITEIEAQFYERKDIKGENE